MFPLNASTDMVKPSTCETTTPDPSVGVKEAMNVCLLGASFETGNLGVNALAESSIKCVLARWPNATVTLLGSSRTEGSHQLHLFREGCPGRQSPDSILQERFSVVSLWCSGVLLYRVEGASVFRIARVRQTAKTV